MVAHCTHRTRVDLKNNLRMMWKTKYYEIPQCRGLMPQEVALAAESGSLTPSETRPVHLWLQTGSLMAGVKGFCRQSILHAAGLGTAVAPAATTKKPFLITESLSDLVDKGQAKSSHWREEVGSYPKLKRSRACCLNPTTVLNQHAPLPGAPSQHKDLDGRYAGSCSAAPAGASLYKVTSMLCQTLLPG